jgi:hypothetical protein
MHRYPKKSGERRTRSVNLFVVQSELDGGLEASFRLCLLTSASLDLLFLSHIHV